MPPSPVSHDTTAPIAYGHDERPDRIPAELGRGTTVRALLWWLSAPVRDCATARQLVYERLCKKLGNAVGSVACVPMRESNPRR